jgi:hypothetical protein
MKKTKREQSDYRLCFTRKGAGIVFRNADSFNYKIAALEKIIATGRSSCTGIGLNCNDGYLSGKN